MAWIGKSQGIFKLHDSDNYCGSYISLEDASEILGVEPDTLSFLPQKVIEEEKFLSELDLHKAWGSGKINSPHKPQIGNARRSLDELIIMKLMEITLPQCSVDFQVKFGRKYVDLKVTYQEKSVFIEFVGPSHFIPQYGRTPTSPLARKREIEDYLGFECVIWPFWIQRCARNVKIIFDEVESGLASVWSTKAFFGDFVYSRSTDVITEISERFRAIREDGIGYMYGNSHTNKPVHPIVRKILDGKEEMQRLIPAGNKYSISYWLPEELEHLSK